MPLVDLPTGERLWFKRTGAGPRLLHIHGSAFGHRNFEKMTPLCAEYAEVIDFDLPGYGESTGAPASSMEGLADQVAGLIAGAELDRGDRRRAVAQIDDQWLR